METLFFMAIYVITLSIHLVMVGYVVGAACLMSVHSICIGFGSEIPETRHWTKIAKDWAPFMLGLGITFGVAPLLFVQVLYKHNFYTSNLLLSHRYMALLPALLLGFYGLYVAKITSKTRYYILVSVLSTVAFIFVALTHAENHLLQLSSNVWKSMYVEAIYFYWPQELWPRVGFWIALLGCALPTVLVLQDLTFSLAVLRRQVLLGVTLMLVTLAWLIVVDPQLATQLQSHIGYGLVVIFFCGLVIFSLGWSVCTSRLMILLGYFMILTSVVIIRELIRFSVLDSPSLRQAHEQAWQTDGMVVFVIFAVINFSIITWIAKFGVLDSNRSRDT